MCVGGGGVVNIKNGVGVDMMGDYKTTCEKEKESNIWSMRSALI